MTDEYQPSIIYRNLEGDVLSAPKPLFRPTKAKPQPGEDDFVLANTRATKRARKRTRARQAAKMQRAYVRREWAKEWEVNQLAQLFNLWDKRVPSHDWWMRQRAQNALLARVEAVRDEDQKRYDKEWEERRKNRDLPAPQPVISHDDVWKRLRGLAKTAPKVTPKVRRAS